ncbi:MAG: ribonuclease HII [Ornithinimicrobium sp.]
MSTRTKRRAVPVSKRPSLRLERTLQRDGYDVLIGMDEVGRGALAGPVSVGVVAINAACRSAPTGVKDSKLLAHPARQALVPRICGWALGYGVGHANPEEIDRWGIMIALRLAGERALTACGVAPDLVLLDGNHDWLTRPERVGLLAFVDDGATHPSPVHQAPVHVAIKADMRCSTVAAASVLAKVERDAHMVQLHDSHPLYRWSENKGYAAPEHLAALRASGTTEQHRRSWNLTGTPARGVDDER